jgi:DNA-binding CsgD family transcriptional regulator
VPRLRESDYRAALELLHEARGVEGPVPFPERILHAIRRLVPCDVVAYHDRVGGRRTIIWVGEPRGPVTPDVRAAERRWWSRDPLTPTDGTRMYSDVFSAREFHRHGIYQELARPLGIEDMARMWLDPSGASRARLELDRPDRCFRERDRAVLDLLLPHLRQLWRIAAALNPIRPTPSGRVARLTAREREIIELVSAGRTNDQVARMLWISSGTVRKHLENAYEKLDVHTRTAAVAALAGGEHQ